MLFPASELTVMPYNRVVHDTAGLSVPEILDAIARHTIPVMEMRPLDKIVYIADKIEPSRPIEHTRAVRERIGISSLHELYLQTFASSLAWLIETRRPVYTGSIKVWNALMRQG